LLLQALKYLTWTLINVISRLPLQRMILPIIIFTVQVCEINLSCGYLKQSFDKAFQFSLWLSESPFYWKSESGNRRKHYIKREWERYFTWWSCKPLR